MAIGTAYLTIWALRRVDSPRDEQRLDPFGLKYEACTVTEWNFVSMACNINPFFIFLFTYVKLI